MLLNEEKPLVKKVNKQYLFMAVSALMVVYLVFAMSSNQKSLEDKEEPIEEETTTEVLPQFLNKKTYGDIKEKITPQIDELIILPAEEQKEKNIGDLSKKGSPPQLRKAEVKIPYIQPAGPTYDRKQQPSQDVAISSQNVDKEAARQSALGWKYNNQQNKPPQAVNAEAGYHVDTSNIDAAEAMLAGLVQNGAKKDSQKEFLKNAGQKQGVYLEEQIQKPISPYQLNAGSIIPGVMISGINSDLPGMITGQVRSNVYDSVTGKHLVIPMGSRLIGSYDSGVLYGQQRVLFAWTRVIFPNGQSVQLRGMTGADLAGYAGVKDSVDFHYMRLTGAILMSSFMAVGTDVLDNGNVARAQAAEDINKSGQKIVDMQLDVKPTLKIRPGYKFNIMVNKDMVLRPYKG